MKMLTALAMTMMLAGPVVAAPCRDAKGHFAKCPPATATSSSGSVTKDSKGRCHGAGGKFVACPK